MNEQKMIEAVRRRTPNRFIQPGDDVLELIIVRKNSRIVAEYDASDSQRLYELARTYGETE